LHRIAGMRIAIPAARPARGYSPAFRPLRARGRCPRLAASATPGARPCRIGSIITHGPATPTNWPALPSSSCSAWSRPTAATIGACPATLADRVDAFEREAIIAAVRAAQGRIATAIATLGLPRKTLLQDQQAGHRPGSAARMTAPRQNGTMPFN
jgi:two-component system C4-dicarboxylate transport response regulator DctD